MKCNNVVFKNFSDVRGQFKERYVIICDFPSMGGGTGPRSFNLTSTASMLGGTKLLRRHIWLVLIHAVEIKQANVMIMLFFGKYLRI